MQVEPYEYDAGASMFDLVLDGLDINGNLFFTFQFNRELFCEKTIETSIKNFKEVVSTVLGDLDTKLKNIEITSDLLSAESPITQAEFVF